MKKTLLIIAVFTLVLSGCGEPSYKDTEMQNLHNQIIECYSFTPTCEEYQEHKANGDKDIRKYIMFNNFEMYKNNCKELVLKLMEKDLDINLDKGGKGIEVSDASLEYYGGLEQGREEKMKPEIQKYIVGKC